MFILPNDVITGEFENYLGDCQGSLFLYNDLYCLMYEAGTGTTRLSAAQAMKIRGVGVMQMQVEAEKLMVLRVTDSIYGLNWVWAVPRGVFYGSIQTTRRLLLTLVIGVLLVTVVMVVGVAFFNYKPIRDLLVYVTGNTPGWGKTKNELEAIRAAYDKTMDEAEALTARMNEMTPLVAQQLVRQLIGGRIDSQVVLQNLACLADMHFSHAWTAALYLSFARQDSDVRMERAVLTLSRFYPENVFIAVGELPPENALCVLINYDVAENETSTAEAFAMQIYDRLTKENAQPTAIGVGTAYKSPLQMNESFAEACAAIQMMPAGESVWRYGKKDPSAMAENIGLYHLSPLSVSLLAEGMRYGDNSIVARALNDILDRITQTTLSLVYFRFCCAELLGVIMRQAEALQLPVSKDRFQHLIDFTTREEFRSAIFALADELCAAMKQRISDNDRQLKENLLNYILTNYKQPELSIQTVADATGVRKTQISTLIKEETGLAFVQYVSFLRMNEFKRLLVQSDETISDLVLQIGYNDVPNFLRKFKSLEGMTPGQYRQLRKFG